MSFRTVVITTHCKLDFRMNYMEIRQADSKKRIYLDDIEVLIIENPAISLTGCLLSELMNRKVKIIFCDHKHNPQAELVSYYGSYDSSRKIRRQLEWGEKIKVAVWTAIVTEKIRQQRLFLEELGHEQEAGLLSSYTDKMTAGDIHNREGHAAKVYFNAVFGMDFSRDDDCFINAALDYGYTVITALFNREITAMGYLTQLGIFHDNIFNPFNLSCDLMEPFRILLDRYIYEHKERWKDFGVDEKRDLLRILQSEIKIAGCKQIFTNAVHMYVQSVFNALEESDERRIRFYQL
ncbi:MAG: type II CRISPR-associated endonuclease Cas1 [Selenomonas ruminantium]|nr:type II CRISPR-associated endonuclease Cas1 [Selenomonas ruminantium]